LSTAHVSSAARMGAEPWSWWTDADLAPDVVPAARIAEGHAVLLTGATGFLGRHIARQLLEREDGDVYCLGRAGREGHARERVVRAVLTAGAAREDVDARLHVLEADLAQSNLGIGAPQYESLAHRIATVIHCAADVSWLKSYSRLRTSNVLPLTPLIRLACHGLSKHFALISSIGVCYSTDSLLQMAEDTDPLPYISTMPLGYAQSKAVAEQLVRQCVNRGLHASIFRLALIGGDSDGMHANAEDFISMLLNGCIRLGYAPDSDWNLDVVPVNFAAQAIVANLGRNVGLQTLHLAHPEPRSWRELILFLNLYGYRIRLEPFANWQRRLEQHPDLNLPLKRLRGFFSNSAAGGAGRTISQVYETSGQARISSVLSDAHLANQRLHYPALNAEYFSAFLLALRRAGAVDEPARKRAPSDHRSKPGSDTLRALHPHNPAWRLAPFEASGSIITEIASWRFGGHLGIYGVTQAQPGSDDASFVLKIKARDDEAVTTAVEVAAVAHPELAHLLERFSDQFQLLGAEARETSFYSDAPAKLLEFAPRCHAQGRDPESGRAMLLLDRLDDVELLNSVDQPHLWTDEYLTAAVRNLATIHALGYADATAERTTILGVQRLDPDGILQALPLYQSLTQICEPYFREWAGTKLVLQARELIADIPTWVPRYACHPRTLIHNDCNPRNMAFRRKDQCLNACWFDWELCALAPPQRDLAELLCFTLNAVDAQEQSRKYVELHRQQLSACVGCDIDPDSWNEGFQLALAELMLRRLTFYTLLHCSIRQSFLPRVLKNWSAMSRSIAG
jgi:thioester reductase-like protein